MLTLALAIGANAVVFGVLNALILRPLNVPQPAEPLRLEHFDDLVLPVVSQLPRPPRPQPQLRGSLPPQHRFTALDTGNDPSQRLVYDASGNYFDVLGIQPSLGRFFHASDEHGPNSAPYIVLA